MILPFLETMITQVCNLKCLGCTNYSDLHHRGFVTWHQGKTWIEQWSKILKINDFGIIGGEPLINPEVAEWIQGTRTLLPEAQIRFTTNGLLLDRQWHVVRLLHDIGNSILKISVHVQNDSIESVIQRIFSSYDWKPVQEYGINRWQTSNGFRFQINRPTYFIKTYKNAYEDMLPYDSDASAAFGRCVQKFCPLLHNGRIYKCSTAGLLADVLKRFGRYDHPQWQRYLSSGIGLDSQTKDIQNFIDNFGKPNVICSQCPDSDKHDVPHQKHVEFR